MLLYVPTKRNCKLQQSSKKHHTLSSCMNKICAHKTTYQELSKCTEDYLTTLQATVFQLPPCYVKLTAPSTFTFPFGSRGGEKGKNCEKDPGSK